MPQTPTVPQVFQDPEFHALPQAEQMKVLQSIDPDYAALPQGEQVKAWVGLKQKFGAIPEVAAAFEKNRQSAAMITKNQQSGAVMPPVEQSPLDYAKALGGEALGSVKAVGKMAMANPLIPDIQALTTNPFTAYEAAKKKGFGQNALDTLKGLNPIVTDSPSFAQNVGGSVTNLAALFAGAKTGAKAILPSAESAGLNFQKAAAAAGDAAVDVNSAGSVALKIKELAESGGSMPKVARDFLRRVTDPEAAPLTYSEARQFYSNASRLSADEMNRLTPVMKRQVGEFTRELGKSIGETAEQAGVGAEHSAAMSEFKNAMRLRGYKDNVIDMLWNATKGAGAVGAGVYGIRKITQ